MSKEAYDTLKKYYTEKESMAHSKRSGRKPPSEPGLGGESRSNPNLGGSRFNLLFGKKKGPMDPTETSNLYEQSFKVDASRLQPKLYPRTQNAKSLLTQMIESQQQSFNRATDISAYNTVYTGQTNSSSRGTFQNFGTKQSISPVQRHSGVKASSNKGTF